MGKEFREDNISEEMMQQATYIEDAEFAVPGTIYEVEVARHLRDNFETKTENMLDLSHIGYPEFSGEKQCHICLYGISLVW